MFLWKVVKFFIMLGIGILIGVSIAYMIVDTGIKSVKDYVQDKPTYHMSNVTYSYERVKEARVGDTCMCPMPDCEKIYEKTPGMRTVCCSHECEERYRKLEKAWETGKRAKEYIESEGMIFL